MVIDAKKFVLKDLSKLVKADWNYKDEDPLLVEKLINNIKRNGQIENLLVRELDTGFFEVVNGNHRFEALQKLGATSAFVYNLGKIPLSQAQRIAIETNETKFHSNAAKLSELFSGLQSEFSVEDMAETMPYSAEEIDHFFKLSNFDPSQYASDGKSLVADDDGDDIIKVKVSEGLQLHIDLVKEEMKRQGLDDDDQAAVEFAFKHTAQSFNEDGED